MARPPCSYDPSMAHGKLLGSYVAQVKEDMVACMARRQLGALHSHRMQPTSLGKLRLGFVRSESGWMRAGGASWRVFVVVPRDP